MKIRISLRKDVFINFIAIDTILSYNITLFTKLTLFIINLIYKIESIRKKYQPFWTVYHNKSL